MILIALGANLPFHGTPPAQTLRAALATLGDNGVTPSKVSAFYETPAWPNPADPPFINAVASIETALDPAALIAKIHEIESMFGRERARPNAPRTLDIDILDYCGRIETGPPELPHPRIKGRGFVLVPLAEIAPNWRHPVSGKTVSELLSELSPAERNLKRADIA
ncbi:MAG TPA: 2-amino-4-hydroxy-6-hydroxymethyldihydropteridine diphosphokinase [Rhizomicrobium sp.]|nr:2-amino-4-hydroxy-6-hydroxymethyldihydropteridine diphosphokinase [Rhizomicrobium sp.]